MEASSPSVFRGTCAGLLVAAVLFFLTLAVFWPARSYDFVNLDDIRYVAHNPIVTHGLSLHSVREAFTTVHEQWWLPLLWISYMADIDLFGPAAYGHHLVNLLLHAANTALLFWVLAAMTGSRWRSAFVAALFAWHPTRVEAVVWIAARKDVLSGLFAMLGLLVYSRYARNPSSRRMTLLFLLMLAGLMSKGILVMFPFLLLLLDIWPLERLRLEWSPTARRSAVDLLHEKAPLFILSAVFIGINLWTHVSGRGENVALLHRLALIPPNVFAYIDTLVFPVRLSFFYPENDTVRWLSSIGSAVALLLITLWLFLRRGKAPACFVGWLWFLIALGPILRGIRLGLARYADRWSYLPLIGLGIAVAWGIPPLRPGLRRRWISAAAVLLLSACVGFTRAYLPCWRDTLTIFQRGVEMAPDAFFLHSLYGPYLFKAGRHPEAARHLERALELQPDDAENLSILGMVWTTMGRADEALELHDKAIRLNPDIPEFHCRRGNAFFALQRWSEASADYEQTLRLDPLHAEAHFNLANLLVQDARTEDALPHYAIAARVRPDVAMNWYHWGLACEALGQTSEALAHYRRALEIQPTLFDIHSAKNTAGVESGARCETRPGTGCEGSDSPGSKGKAGEGF
ncbi:MAG TPA: tetratricopeptide repeat protein [Kiritimatiellia bacterium]|nr:tetratricopeptide repeat protein [Kiritimatiellia bacterium]